jgi:hypothetical protein
MRSFVLRAAAVALAICALPAAASAGWIAAGSVSSSGGENTDAATVTYAVFQNTSSSTSSSGNFFGATGITVSQPSNSDYTSTASDLSQYAYIFVYQVSQATQHVVDSLYVSGLNTAAAIATGDTFASVTSASGSTPASATFNTNQTTVIMTGIDYNYLQPGTSANATQFTFGDVGDGTQKNPGTNVAYLTTTGLMIVGSNSYNPTGVAETADGGYDIAILPVPGPEPSTFALLGVGLPLLGWGYARRLRASKALAVAGV